MAINERIRLSPSTHCPVDVVFDQGEVVRFSGLAEAEEFLDWLENTPPEQRQRRGAGESARRGQFTKDSGQRTHGR